MNGSGLFTDSTTGDKFQLAAFANKNVTEAHEKDNTGKMIDSLISGDDAPVGSGSAPRKSSPQSPSGFIEQSQR